MFASPRRTVPRSAMTTAPAGTPDFVIRTLNERVLAALQVASVRSDFERRGYAIVSNSPEDFAAFIKAEITRIGAIVNELGIRPEQ